MESWGRTFLSVAIVLCAGSAHADVPTANKVFDDLGFPADKRQQVLAGEFVKLEVPTTFDREVATRIAFLVKAPPEPIIEQAEKGLVIKANPNTVGLGPVSNPAVVGDFADLTLKPGGAAEAKAFSEASPGQALNLDENEIKALRALRGQGEHAVLAELRKLLTARAKAYQGAGLDGMPPYARGDDRTLEPGDQLRTITEASVHLKKYLPKLYEALLEYPDATTDGMDEQFAWTTYGSSGSARIVLTHRLSMREGNIYAVAQCQFYVSQEYNVEQAVMLLLPVQEGTLVTYVNRTSTDQVAGFGSSAKRSIGERLMTREIEDLFQKIREIIEKA